MIIVIIAGGSGTRLWPLSTPDYPKHLLKINGHEKSLLQNAYDRAKKLSDKIYIVPEVSHIEHVREQLSDLPDDAFIVEPARRGTANCIIAALNYITEREDNDEPIGFIHADHYIRDIKGFMHSFKVAAAASSKDNRLVLVGVEPDHPATGFGYIEKGELFDEEAFVFNVNMFKEKPDYNTAKQYIRSGNYLWNCGYFVGSVKVFLDTMKAYAPDLLKNYQQLQTATNPEECKKTYLSFSSDAIDYALIERVKNLLVVPASFDWMDIGSYADMHKAVDSDEQGNHVHGGRVEIEEVENSFVQNHEDKPISVIGLDNVIVVNTKHGLIVARKDMSQKVGEVAKRIQSNS